jgi:tRNA threonylcarbamoyl adenosine modification protein YeaZ
MLNLKQERIVATQSSLTEAACQSQSVVMSNMEKVGLITQLANYSPLDARRDGQDTKFLEETKVKINQGDERTFVDCLTQPADMGNSGQVVLILDSAINLSYVLVSCGSKICFFEQFNSTPSTTLISTLERGLRESGFTLKDITLIATSIGPGSYTGLRVSASIAQAFAYGLKIPLVTYSSLECFNPPKEGSFIAVLDAKSGGFYTVQGIKVANKITYLTSPKRQSEVELIDALSKVDFLLSSDIESLKKRLPSVEKFINVEIDPTRIISLISEKEKITEELKLDLLYL